ncbi:MAG: sulfotransferase family 2 domain-containing protein [Aggregatilineales bacterium]
MIALLRQLWPRTSQQHSKLRPFAYPDYAPFRPLAHDDVLYFLHVQKTAGTTFTRHLWRHFSHHEICPVSLEPLWATMPKKQRQNYRLYAGHFGFNFYHHMRRPLVYITILRDPIDRALSNYEHILRYPEHRLHALAHQLPMTQFIRHRDASAEMGSLQVRHIGEPLNRQRRTNPYWPVTEKTLATAKRRLLSFAFFGLAERMDDSLALLAYTFGWPPPAPAARLNAAPQRKTRDDYPPDAIAALHELNQLDIELYQWAKPIFEERLAALRGVDLEAHYRAAFAAAFGPPVQKWTLTMDAPIPGRGWHPYEPESNCRWTGPETCAIIDLRLQPRDYRLEINILTSMGHDILNGFSVTLNEVPVAIELGYRLTGEMFYYGVIPAAAIAADALITRLALHTPHTISSQSIGTGDDTRKLGIAVRKISITPI